MWPHPLAADVMYPTAERLLERCDGVLRLPGDSRGADQDVAIARRRGIPVYTSLAEVPGVAESDSGGGVSDRAPSTDSPERASLARASPEPTCRTAAAAQACTAPAPACSGNPAVRSSA